MSTPNDALTIRISAASTSAYHCRMSAEFRKKKKKIIVVERRLYRRNPDAPSVYKLYRRKKRAHTDRVYKRTIRDQLIIEKKYTSLHYKHTYKHVYIIYKISGRPSSSSVRRRQPRSDAGRYSLTARSACYIRFI